MTNEEAKVVIGEVLAKLKESIKREDGYLKELDDDTLLLETVTEMQGSGEALPDLCNYGSYDEWITQLNKEIRSTETSIGRIGKEKAEIVAFEYFIANATDV